MLADVQGICKFSVEFFFILQMAIKHLSSLLSFRQTSVSNVAQVIAATVSCHCRKPTPNEYY